MQWTNLVIYGGTAIVWDSSIKGSITRINFENNRLCGLIFKRENISFLIINVYMPCDKYINDDEYIDALNVISQTLYKYNPSHFVIGGDFNVDFSRTSPNTHILYDFITDFNLDECINSSYVSVPYTFINHDNITSRIDHFLHQNF